MTQPDLVPDKAELPEPVTRNIASIQEWKRRRRSERALSDKVADAISQFAGSMPFVYIHLAVFGFWIIANLGWVPGVSPWDPSLVVLAMAASVEAIFLSTFVLINQNLMTAEADEKADLDLQVSLLNERETTRLIHLVEAIASKVGVEASTDLELEQLRQETNPDAILDAVERGRKQS